MANKRITDLPLKSPIFTDGEVGVVDDGTNTYQADMRYWGLSSASIAYNPDGTVATVTKAGRTTVLTYAAGRLTGSSDGVVQKALSYDGDGQIITITVSET